MSVPIHYAYSRDRPFKIKSLTPFGGTTSSEPNEGGGGRVYDRASFIEMVEETKDLNDKEFAVWYKKEKENFESFEDECRQLHEFKLYMDECAMQEKADRKREIGIQRRKE